jgi:hypothetical protein
VFRANAKKWQEDSTVALSGVVLPLGFVQHGQNGWARKARTLNGAARNCKPVSSHKPVRCAAFASLSPNSRYSVSACRLAVQDHLATEFDASVKPQIFGQGNQLIYPVPCPPP